jgi:hypothetical protein
MAKRSGAIFDEAIPLISAQSPEIASSNSAPSGR